MRELRVPEAVFIVHTFTAGGRAVACERIVGAVDGHPRVAVHPVHLRPDHDAEPEDEERDPCAHKHRRVGEAHSAEARAGAEALNPHLPIQLEVERLGRAQLALQSDRVAAQRKRAAKTAADVHHHASERRWQTFTNTRGVPRARKR